MEAALKEAPFKQGYEVTDLLWAFCRGCTVAAAVFCRGLAEVMSIPITVLMSMTLAETRLATGRQCTHLSLFVLLVIHPDLHSGTLRATSDKWDYR